MKILRNIKKMREVCRSKRKQNLKIGFVPTMGALHQGHLSLIRQARQENNFLVVSIFVNPAQFGQGEDFGKYPRNFKKDYLLCRKEKADIIFAPLVKQMYPDHFKTFVEVQGLSDCLCGRFRPGHFRGVATVVTKLFNIINPHTAYFGAKDAQQTSIIKKLVSDLNIPVEIKVMPTIRQNDGLALSSRNIYLDTEERSDALVLSAALNLAAGSIRKGIRDPGNLIRLMKGLIEKKESAKIDYISILDLENLLPVKRISGSCLIALAVWIGRTRLIDNMVVNLR